MLAACPAPTDASSCLVPTNLATCLVLTEVGAMYQQLQVATACGDSYKHDQALLAELLYPLAKMYPEEGQYVISKEIYAVEFRMFTEVRRLLKTDLTLEQRYAVHVSTTDFVLQQGTCIIPTLKLVYKDFKQTRYPERYLALVVKLLQQYAAAEHSRDMSYISLVVAKVEHQLCVFIIGVKPDCAAYQDWLVVARKYLVHVRSCE